MRHAAFAVVVLGLVAIASMPAAPAASHGVAWTANGVAVKGADAAAIKVHWSGNNFFLCQQGYTVTLTSLAGGVLESRSFAGYQVQTQIPSQEVFQETFTSQGQSTDPGVSFNWRGVQSSLVGYALVHETSGVIQGTYQGWTFAAVNPLGPIDFNAC